MRISDWSSDVCSSDLNSIPGAADSVPPLIPGDPNLSTGCEEGGQGPATPAPIVRPHESSCWQKRRGWAKPHFPPRSAEHTSELQSLMRISYAVFCLKKKHKHLPTLQLKPLTCA